MDYTDLLKSKKEMICSGRYYDVKPLKPNVDGYKLFNYNPLEERFKQYNTVENIQIDARRLRIETKDRLGFKINKFIRTQDGEWWTITDIQETTEKKGSLRFRKVATDTKFIISLINVENAWEDDRGEI